MTMSIPQVVKSVQSPNAGDFYRQLWPDPAAWAYWWFAGAYQKTLDDGTVKDYGYTLWFPVARPAPIPARFQQLAAYHGVHTVSRIPQRTYTKTGKPVPPERMRAAGGDITGISCVYADFDCGPGKAYADKSEALAHLDTLPVYPTATIDSGGGVHTYWMLSEPVSVGEDNHEELRRLQAAWVQLVAADNGAHDLQRVLRVPGTLNRKYDPPRPVQFVEYRPRRCYDLVDLLKLAGDHMAGIEAQERLQREVDASRLDTPAAGAAAVIMAAFVRDAKDGERHRYALWAVHRLHDEGIPGDVTLACLEGAAREIAWVPDAKELSGIVRKVYGGAK